MKGLLPKVDRRSDAWSIKQSSCSLGFVPSDIISRREVDIHYEEEAIQEYRLLDKQSKVFLSSKVQFLL